MRNSRLTQPLRMAHALLLFRCMSTTNTTQPRLQRDPDEWKTGDEPMTAAQRSYLETLCNDTGERSMRTCEG
jgi:hypothetical protein